MTKASAIYNFWASFGLDTYEENSVYQMDDAPTFPYLTYEFNSDSFGDNSIPLSASLWYRTTSWVKANEKAEEISKAIGMGGIFLKCDGGYIWIKRSSPFSQSMGDASDNMVKRKLLSISADFLTAD